MPPRHGKSQTTSRYLPAWFLGTFPDRNVILTSYGADFAAGWGRRARTLIEEHGRQTFGVEVSQASKAADRWDIAGYEGGMLTAGVGGSITGRGADLFIIDDPIKNAADAQSDVLRAKQWEWWQSTALTRLEPGAVVIVIMTRWHENDLAGRLLSEAAEEGEPWHEIRLPALAEKSDPLGRKVGEALWPERWPLARLERKRRAVGSYYWQAMYQQRPSPPEGAIFHRGWWKSFDELPEPKAIVQSWDMSFEDTDGSSYVVGQVWVRDLAHKHLACQIRARMDFPTTLRAVEALTAWTNEHWPGQSSHAKLVEKKANGPAVVSTLKRKIAGLIAVEPQGSKVARAAAIAPEVEAGNVHLPERRTIPAPKGYEPTTVDEFVDEHAGFPNAAYDDQVDATSQALLRMARQGRKRGFRGGGYDPDRFDAR